MKTRKFTFIILSISILFSIGHSSWSILSNKKLTPYYDAVSALTEHIDNSEKTDEYIFENTINPETVETSITYSSISSDSTYFSTERTIYLGYTDGTNLEVDKNVHFMHKNSAFAYSESNFTGSTNFCFSSTTSRTYSYFSSAANETNSKPSTFTYSDKWTNYYHFDNTLTEYKNGTAVKTKLPGRLYTIKLVGDIVIKSGYSLSIGAEVGSSTQPHSGTIIEGYFVELDLNGHNLTIESGATLNAYGYIIDSKLDDDGKHKGCIYNYGKLYTPFVVENFLGGGYTVATGAYGTSPFSIYDMPYLSCKTIFYYGSNLMTPTGLAANDSFNKVVVSFIGISGSNSLIELTSGSYVVRDAYNPIYDNNKTTFASKYKAYYDLYGNIDIKTFSLNLKVVIEKKINMAEFGMAIPPYANISINSGTVSLGMRMDFMPGSTLKVASNAKVKFTKLSLTSDETIAGNAMTTYGGIRALSQLTAENTTSYCTFNSMGTTAAYDSYLAQEKNYNQDGNTSARLVIEGTIEADSSVTTSKAFVLGGKINLSPSAYSYLTNTSNFSKFNTYYATNEYYAYISGTNLTICATLNAFKPTASDIQGYSERQVCSVYHLLPLVSKGKVVKAATISSSLNDTNTTYDFSEGVFTSNGNKYAYIPNNENERDASGTIREVTHDVSTHTITYNSQNYVFFKNMFVKSTTAVNDNIYVYNDSYSSASYYQTYHIIDFTNNQVDYSVRYSSNSYIDTAQFITSRSRESESYWLFGTRWRWGDYNIGDSTWNANTGLSWTLNGGITYGTELTSTTSYALWKTNITSYNFTHNSINYGGKDSYKNIISTNLVSRPIIASKFTQSTDLKKYKIGSVNLSYNITEEKQNTTEWEYNYSTVSSVSDSYSKGSSSASSGNVHTQTKTVTGTQKREIIGVQSWSVSGRGMFVDTYSTCLKWNPTYGCWIKG